MKPAPIAVVAALIESGGELGEDGQPLAETKVFLARRSAGAGHGGLWELPGGKVESGESEEAALIREIREELGAEISTEGKALRYQTEVGGRDFTFIVFPSRFRSSEAEGFSLAAHDEWRYFSSAELENLELAPLDGPALQDWAASAHR
jgi:mutator protein MutT